MRVVILSVVEKKKDAVGVQDEAQECRELVRSSEGEVVASLVVRRDKPDPRTLVGRGKIDEVSSLLTASGADMLVVNNELTPVQEKELEKLLGCPVMDRTALILGIFARRAQSREGKLQVELAQLQYLSSRLVRRWTHLERQRGGIGMRGGPGESQIELDRRQIADKMKGLKSRLSTLRKQRDVQSRARLRGASPLVSIVGYTNAGKSTLFNALVRENKVAADLLFATLDTTRRRLFLNEQCSIILSDTVGFVRNLPHTLVEAFRSTLEEVSYADLILHVVDRSHPSYLVHVQVTDDVLRDMGAGDIPKNPGVE